MRSDSLKHLFLFFTILRSSIALPQLPSTIPEDEVAALQTIIEDEVSLLDDDHDEESPNYSLMFRLPLPVPPIKQPIL
jgi:hypothetical protein